MQIKLFRQFIVLFLAAFLVACSGSGPEKVAEKYFNSILNADMDGFMSTVYLSEEEKAGMNMMRGKIEEMFKAVKMQAEASGGIKSVKAKNASYSDGKKKARVTIITTFKNGNVEEESLNLISTDKGWKVQP